MACKPANNALALGEYRGEKSGITEVILLKKDGVFDHSAFRDGKQILSESGTFTVSPNEVTFVEFTEVYDVIMDAMRPPGKKFNSYAFTYIRDDAFAELKADDERKFALIQWLP
ncbi:hypothetical protein [Luteolibacter soli]|uniref:Uncharacterized protein n=1 Tax=Luteolibacter soli TaxID=3135280 RepID=A0ABU9AYH3_9BACT